MAKLPVLREYFCVMTGRLAHHYDGGVNLATATIQENVTEPDGVRASTLYEYMLGRLAGHLSCEVTELVVLYYAVMPAVLGPGEQ